MKKYKVVHSSKEEIHKILGNATFGFTFSKYGYWENIVYKGKRYLGNYGYDFNTGKSDLLIHPEEETHYPFNPSGNEIHFKY
jgi:hypothetical protein